MEQAKMTLETAVCFKVNFGKTRSTVKELIPLQMEASMKAVGSTTSCMAKVR